MTPKRKVMMFIAMSLDGYIATKDESLEWLFKHEGDGDNGYEAFYDTIDTVIMGRKTYEWIKTEMSGGYPYKGKENYIFSAGLTGEKGDVIFVNEDPVSFTEQLKKQEGKDIWIVGGGELLLPLIKEKVVDEMIIAVAPTLIGNGIPLFKEGEYELDLELMGTRRFDDFVELHYRVKKE
ncbi:dihydrofolate reductase [Bacillus sp. H-16]|uniref:dihydrofolate reductase family protein n=1 Tax=Alteribacter salitolerans TaxID=2912333 RepID=UPI0019657664|nr:dihydrofolate reductase family protein [Alteribacter salitolerans]MBM7096220.1 dihydrofolate reductase [Alteribacter salitolerans]